MLYVCSQFALIFLFVLLNEYTDLLQLITYQLHEDYVTKKTRTILIVTYLRRNCTDNAYQKYTLTSVS